MGLDVDFQHSDQRSEADNMSILVGVASSLGVPASQVQRLRNTIVDNPYAKMPLFTSQGLKKESCRESRSQVCSGEIRQVDVKPRVKFLVFVMILMLLMSTSAMVKHIGQSMISSRRCCG